MEVQNISDEVALLIASAQGKGINVLVWLTEGGVEGQIRVSDFNSKLVSLGLVVGVQEDPYTKKQLELATSKASLKQIFLVCGSHSASGEAVIDSSIFLDMCDRKFEQINQNRFEDNDKDEDVLQATDWNSFDVDFAAEQYISEARTWSGAGVHRPVSAPAGQTGAIPLPKPADRRQLAYKDASTDDEHNECEFLPQSVQDSHEPNLPGTASITYPGSTRQEDRERTLESNFDNIQVSASPELVDTSARLFVQRQQEQSLEAPVSAASAATGVIAATNRGPLPRATSASAAASRESQSSRLREQSTALWAKQDASARDSRDVRQSRISLADKLQQRIGGGISRSMSADRSRKSRDRVPSSSPVRVSAASSSHFLYGRGSWELDDPDRLTFLQQQVERTVCNCVRQTDLYHIVQVHLGYIHCYTMIPARGQVVSSVERPWLSCRDIQTAFAAARLRLNDTQVFVLMKIIQDFADNLSTSSTSSDKMVVVDDAIEIEQRRLQCSSAAVSTEESKIRVVNKGKLSASWLAKYLVYLRVESKRILASASSVDESSKTASAPNESSKSKAKTLDWEGWLSQKQGRSVSRPAEFKKALSGQSHLLSVEEIDRALSTMEIIPPHLLKLIIDLKVRSWVSNVDGRGDFMHKLNAEMWRFKDSEVKKIRNKQPGVVWEKLGAKERKEVIDSLTHHLTAAKSKELKEVEKEKATITRELYWKYDKACRGSSNPISSTWGDWLNSFISTEGKLLDSVRVNSEHHKLQAAKLAATKKSVAGWTEVETRLKSAASSLGTSQGIEVRKGLIALRKVTQDRSHGKTALVLKEDFDRCLQNVLAPKMKSLSREAKQLTGAAADTHVSNEQSENVFQNDEEAVVQRVVQAETAKTAESEEKFEAWKREKLAKKMEKLAAENREKETADKERAKKEKESAKAYRLWLKAHKKNKYISKVDGRAHSLPQSAAIKHSTSWRAEV